MVILYRFSSKIVSTMLFYVFFRQLDPKFHSCFVEIEPERVVQRLLVKIPV